MDSEQNTPPLHEYPNADRVIGEEEKSAIPKRPLVHIADALKAKFDSEDPQSIRTIRTYQSDVASAVKNDNISLIKISLAEKKRQEQKGTPEEIQSNSKKTLYISIGAAVLVVLGITAIIFGYAGGKIFNAVPVNNATLASQNTLFFKTEAESTIDITGADAASIINLVRVEKQKKLRADSIKNINFVQTNGSSTEPVSMADLLNKINAGAPDALLRTLNPQYLFGIYSNNTAKDTFLLVNVDSYDQAYAGMISWESTLKNGIGGLFINPPAPTTGTSTVNTLGDQASFIDKVIDNKDTRELVDSQGNIEMLYTFPDTHTLLIVSSESMFKEITTRLTTGLIIR